MSKYRRYRQRKYRPYKFSPIEFGLAIAVLLALGLGAFTTKLSFDSLLLFFFAITFIFAFILLFLLTWTWFNGRKRMQAIELSGVDTMEGIAFENYLKFLLVRRGFTHVTVTVAQGDFGADLVAQKNDGKYAIQAKRYTGLVGVDAIYQVLGGEKYYHCNRNMVITNSYFTTQARELSEKTGTILIDREKLATWIEEVKLK